MSYDIERTKKIQSVLLDIMKELHKVLVDNGYVYWLSSGSALGAIRHNGFIPWDDDLDIGMPREDYNRFLKEANSILPSHLYIQHPGNEKKTHVMFAKVRMKNTLFEEEQNKNMDYPRGIYIDIFPFDSINGKGKKEEKTLKKARFFKSLYFLRQRKDKINFAKKIIKVFTYFIPRRQLIKKYDKLICNKKDGEYLIDSYTFYEFEKIIYTKDVILNPVLHSFEDAEFYVPYDCDKYLKQLYGDYMTLPPIEKRGIQHCVNRIEFEYDDSKYFNNKGE